MHAFIFNIFKTISLLHHTNAAGNYCTSGKSHWGIYRTPVKRNRTALELKLSFKNAVIVSKANLSLICNIYISNYKHRFMFLLIPYIYVFSFSIVA